MILRPVVLLLSACFFGTLLSCARSILNAGHSIDPFTAAGVIFSLGIGALFITALARLLVSAILLAFAAFLLIAPVVTWIATSLHDPLGDRARRHERALIHLLYPPPSHDRSFHVQA